MVAILKRELSSYFNSAVAYVVMAVYFLFSGLFFSMICIENDTSSLSYVFGNMFIIILFIIPIITMKSFSEEKRQRTDQALLTSPTSLFEIVMGKFLGALILFAICSLIFVVYALVISFFTSPDWAVVLCTVLGLLLLGSALIAIDIFISVLTESMIISAVAGMGVGLLIYMLSNLSSNITVDWIATIVKKIDGKDIICEVINGGKLTNRKSINIPGMNINLPSITQKDIDDIKFGIIAGFDYIAASFVRKPEDVLAIRKILEENDGTHIKIISKIENREGINNFDKILEVSDGIMVARGDLGVEIPMEEVPVRQKEFISKCAKAGKPVITATQMLESMILNPRPTRAEVSDVANAIYDMSTSIMLSGESATGIYPIECVKTMAKISETIEDSIKYWKRFKNKEYAKENKDLEYSLNYSTCTTAMELNAKAIFAYTNTGRTATMLAGFFPQCPIYIITDNEITYRQMALLWNINPILVDKDEDIDKMINNGIEIAKKYNYVKKDDIIVIAGGASILSCHDEATTNRTIGGVLKI